MNEVADYAAARARRLDDDLPALGAELADDVGDEALAALRAAPELSEDVHVAEALPPLLAQWLRFREAVAEAMEGSGLYTIDDVERIVLSGEAYLFPGAAAAIIAQPVTYPSGETVLQTLWAVGDLAEVLTLEPALCASARLVGCSRVLIEGRRGWERLLKPAGYAPWSVTVCKVL